MLEGLSGWCIAAENGRRRATREEDVLRAAARSALGFIYVPYWTALLGGGVATRLLPGGPLERSHFMSEDQHYTWQGNVIHETESESHVAALRYAGPHGPLVVTIGDIDLPAFVSDGLLHIQAPLPLVFKAFAEDLSDFIRDMEIRVSDARRRPLSLDSDGRSVHRAPVAKPRVVRDRRER